MNQEERVYNTMKHAGAAGVTLGIIVLVSGIVSGVLMIINGARLLVRKSDIVF